MVLVLYQIFKQNKFHQDLVGILQKNIYILLGLIILGLIIYFFIFKKKNKKLEESKDIYTNIPTNELPMPNDNSYQNIVHPEINNTTEIICQI